MQPNPKPKKPVTNGVCACTDMTAEAVYAKLTMMLRLTDPDGRPKVKDIQDFMTRSLRGEAHKEVGASGQAVPLGLPMWLTGAEPNSGSSSSSRGSDASFGGLSDSPAAAQVPGASARGGLQQGGPSLNMAESELFSPSSASSSMSPPSRGHRGSSSFSNRGGKRGPKP